MHGVFSPFVQIRYNPSTVRSAAVASVFLVSRLQLVFSIVARWLPLGSPPTLLGQGNGHESSVWRYGDDVDSSERGWRFLRGRVYVHEGHIIRGDGETNTHRSVRPPASDYPT